MTKQLTWIVFAPCDLGYIPGWLHEDDPDSASKQINKNYQHGGGWHPFGAGVTKINPQTYVMKYPGDPPLRPLAMAKLRDELIVFYPHAWVAIIQKDDSFELARID